MQWRSALIVASIIQKATRECSLVSVVVNGGQTVK